jgi:hypothetical protein
MSVNQLFFIIFINSCIISKDKSPIISASEVMQIELISQPCDIDVLVTIDKAGTFKKDEIELFISVIDTRCIENVEFMQFVNELVFRALSINHIDFADILLNYDQSDFIYQIIESPLNDEIDLDQIITKIENEEFIKYEKILKSLKKAKMKIE